MPERVAARLEAILHPQPERRPESEPPPKAEPPRQPEPEPQPERAKAELPRHQPPRHLQPEPAKAEPPKAEQPEAELPRRTKPRATVTVPPVAAACPYCATLLAPPPTASRRCPRCRQRIVVRHDGGRTVLLTEAAVTVFEAERRRAAGHPRYARHRDRWLKLAIAAGAPEARVRRIGDGLATAASVEAARALYAAACDRAFRTARHDRHWERAERIRRDEATQVHRLAGRPVPPPAEAVALYREGVAARLRGLSDTIAAVDLTGPTCCETCDTDRGRTARIASEIRTPTLPHAGCPAGLCRCRWAVPAGDLAEVRRARRRARAAASGRHG